MRGRQRRIHLQAGILGHPTCPRCFSVGRAAVDIVALREGLDLVVGKFWEFRGDQSRATLAEKDKQGSLTPVFRSASKERYGGDTAGGVWIRFLRRKRRSEEGTDPAVR